MMFQELLKTVHINISTVRSIIQVNERLRENVFGIKSIIAQERGTQANSIIDELTQNALLMGEAYCQLATIKSIQVDDANQESVQTSRGMELGLKFDVEARKKLRLYVVK